MRMWTNAKALLTYKREGKETSKIKREENAVKKKKSFRRCYYTLLAKFFIPSTLLDYTIIMNANKN